MSQYRPLTIKALLLSLLAVAWAPGAAANGEIGEHVKDLKTHLSQYEGEVEQLINNVDGLVSDYADNGREAVDPEQVIEWWESVKVHAAIETNLVPVYALVWQGLFGVKQALEQGEPVSAVRRQQQALEEALWQGLGAVKMAAKLQNQQPVTSSGSETPRQALQQVLVNLDTVIVRFAEGNVQEAEELVHATYANRFEGVEGLLIEQDADLVADLEQDFNVALPQALKSGNDLNAVKDVVQTMKTKLERADSLLEKAEAEQKDVF